MQINIIAIGKRMPPWIQAGYNEYTKRMPANCRIQLIEIPSSKRVKDSDTARLLRLESELMLNAIPKNTSVIALDVTGRLWDTYQLAKQLQNWLEKSQDITLLIGGPEGLTDDCLKASQMKWSLSPLTFPHPLVRVILAEQLYRAWTIITHHPYHRS